MRCVGGGVGGGSLQQKEGSRWGRSHAPARGVEPGWKEGGPARGGDPASAAGVHAVRGGLRGSLCSGGARPLGEGEGPRPTAPLRSPSPAGPGSPPLLWAGPGAWLWPPVALRRRERREPAEPPPPLPPPSPQRLAPFDTHTPANMAAGRGRAGCVRAPAGHAPAQLRPRLPRPPP